MTDRKIEERFEFDNGIKGESEKDARRVIAEMNKKSKAEKSSMRYRSVADCTKG